MKILPILALAVLAGAGCRRDTQIPSGPPPGDTTTPLPALAGVAGDSQTAIVGSTLPTSLAVKAADANGHGVPGVLVQFSVLGTNASLKPSSGMALTGADGIARVALTLGPRAEPVRVVAAGTGATGTATFDLVALTSPALTLVVVSGDSQVVALPGSSLEPFVVAVRDTFGNRVAARPVVVFRVVAGGVTYGGHDSTAVAADSAGNARPALLLTAPADGDTVRVTASFAGMAKPALRALAVGLAFRGKTWGAGYGSVCGLAAGGTAYCWGSGASGALGTGDSTDRDVPTAVTAASGFVAVDAGEAAGCGLGASGSAACWGSPTNGGEGGGDLSFRSLETAFSWACGVTSAGTAQCWGRFFDPFSGSRVTIPSPVRFAQITVGGSYACALTADGRAYCWGSSNWGQLGAGDIISSSTAALPVVGGLTFRSLSAGGLHVCGLTTAGAAYCWGYGAGGELGNGALTASWHPVAVAGGLTFGDISAAGGHHTCALTTTGAAYCWGDNGAGQLGIGSRTDSPTPLPVTGGITFVSIGVGDSFTCGVAVGGAMYCWGDNSAGQLGTGAFGGTVPTPTLVTGGLLFQTAAAGERRSPWRAAPGAVRAPRAVRPASAPRAPRER